MVMTDNGEDTPKHEREVYENRNHKRREIFVISDKKCYSIFRMIFCKAEMIPKI